MADLLPCPFCGGEAEKLTSTDGFTSIGCLNCNPFFGVMVQRGTEAEAIAAWNTRAAYEMEGWFYLPKPKQRLFDYTTGFSFDDVSLKATGTVDVYALADAVRKWQEEELNQHIIERICEVFKPERTCNRLWTGAEMICSRCTNQINDATANYCPSCGAKISERT